MSESGKAAGAAPDQQGVDVVYTWVDGAYPGYDELLRKYARHPLDLNPNRFRDNLDILKYSIRSLERYAPWLNHLYIVATRPQVPRWLDLDAPGLTLVYHEEIFDPDDLPSFNSLAIVCNLYKIPGLSRRFIYFEDDQLLGRPVAPNDFVDDQGRIRIYEKPSLEGNPSKYESEKLSLWASVLAYSNHLLDQRYGRRRRGSLHDVPVLFDTVWFSEFVDQWKDEVKRTSASRFRDRRNLAPEHMFPYYLFHESKAVFVSKLQVYRDSSYLGADNIWPFTFLGLQQLRLRRPKFYCLNDNFGERPNPRSVAWVRAFLEEQYPVPSRFEKR